MVDDELAAAIEQLGKRPFAISALEYIALIYFGPGQLTPQPAQFIACPRELLLLEKKRLACGEPFRL